MIIGRTLQLTSLCSPIGRCTVVLMSACLPISIHPRIVAKGGCVFQLGFGDFGSVTLQGSVYFRADQGIG